MKLSIQSAWREGGSVRQCSRKPAQLFYFLSFAVRHVQAGRWHCTACSMRLKNKKYRVHACMGALNASTKFGVTIMYGDHLETVCGCVVGGAGPAGMGLLFNALKSGAMPELAKEGLIIVDASPNPGT
nr:hypothetical protein [Tanacetum cinerariifolium]